MEYGVEIARTIAELGILTVISGIFLYITVRNNKRNEENNQTLFKTMLEQIKATQQTPHVLTEKEDREAIRVDRAINSHIQDAVGDLGASRVMVARYHNGGKDMNAISFLKVSITNEAVAKGLRLVGGEFQNIFRSLVAYICDEVDKEGKCFIMDLDSIKEIAPGVYEMLRSRGLRSIYCYAITNINDYPIGMVIATYAETNKHEESIEKLEKYLSYLSGKISGLLSIDEEEDEK